MKLSSYIEKGAPHFYLELSKRDVQELKSFLLDSRGEVRQSGALGVPNVSIETFEKGKVKPTQEKGFISIAIL